MAECVKKEIGNFKVTIYPRFKRGMFGDIYKGIHNKTNKSVIVKELQMNHYGHSNMHISSNIEKEIEILRNLKDHKNIVQYLDHISSSESHYIVLEMCELGDLREYLTSKTDSSKSEKLDIMSQSASALLYLHTRNPPIIHWDIKLENMLLHRKDNEISLKLTDFGLSKECGESTGFTIRREPGLHYGSRTCAAPEFYDNHGNIDFTASVDVFALGLLFAVLYKHCKNHKVLYPTPAEPILTESYNSFGRYLYEHNQSASDIHAIIDLDAGDDLPTRCVKRMLQDMTCFNPNDRPTMEKIEIEIQAVIKAREKLATIDELQKSNSKLLVEWNRANSKIDQLNSFRETMKERNAHIEKLGNSLAAAKSQMEHMKMTIEKNKRHATELKTSLSSKVSVISNLKDKMQRGARKYEKQCLSFNCIQTELDEKNKRIEQVEAELKNRIGDMTCLERKHKRLITEKNAREFEDKCAVVEMGLSVLSHSRDNAEMCLKNKQMQVELENSQTQFQKANRAAGVLFSIIIVLIAYIVYQYLLV